MKIIRISTIPLSLNILLKGQLKFLAEHFDVIGISSKGQLLDEVRDREGINIIPVEMERGISPIEDLRSLFELYRIFRKEKPNIVHSITPKAGLLSMLAAKFAGIPIRVHTFTGLIFPSKSGILKRILIIMDQLLCWAATSIYPEGKGVKDDLIRFNITKKPLNVLANGNVNGINLDFFNLDCCKTADCEILKKHLKIEPEDFIFIFVGRLVGDKGINELIEAFSKLKRSSVKLLLVGPFESDLDPLSDSTQKEIETNPDIISVGFQKDVRPYFAIADALVFPSYREGFPNVVMQAGAMELPAIVSNINGCNEIIVEGVNGTIIPVKDSQAIHLALLRFLDDKQYYNRLKVNSRKMIADRYEQSVVWNALLEEYNELLANYKK